MQGYIYLIGGGEIANGETKEIDDVIKQDATEKSSFVFLGTAAHDSAGYIDTIRSVFEDRFNIVAATEEKGREFAVDAINNATVIYLGGGTTELLINLFRKWEIVDLLRQALKRGTNIAGMSAGAQALSTWYIHEDNDSLGLRRGWGLAHVCLLVHANKKSVEQVKTLWQKNDNAKLYNFLAIGERAAWRIGITGESKVGSGEVWEEPSIFS